MPTTGSFFPYKQRPRLLSFVVFITPHVSTSLSLLPTPSPPNPTLPIPHSSSQSHRTLLTNNRPAGEGGKGGKFLSRRLRRHGGRSPDGRGEGDPGLLFPRDRRWPDPRDCHSVPPGPVSALPPKPKLLLDFSSQSGPM